MMGLVDIWILSLGTSRSCSPYGSCSFLPLVPPASTRWGRLFLPHHAMSIKSVVPARVHFYLRQHVGHSCSCRALEFKGKLLGSSRYLARPYLPRE
ncbi:hypothetical protein BDP55DRAFT_671737 [Colletotrichum godetiae]|uniref:Uncharacterized protein n=1 Tax=Colletotrichum godetiae TaxID=1209918 RepID=A0AAJ0A8K3_9PEZI|nr:uncharacterized protein BDP55DRAFT_688807 [Colletotrichum godetiae]XP_060426773.1 uncharacterized protein BDP55DRAFT_671737 [Colletotrichum godetiae]KAK1656515.1 hypothetical protein BDP55DRAFT_688807 [Colletotrichum godetiae]KAK1672770.1 hypothetical protein BDP55DRAFT_671737 [Colletotrichum godetiae]